MRGTVSPVDIIPVAEDMGLIVDLGRWILRRACLECMKWPGKVSVAVNFSPQQFHQRDVLSEIRYALEVSGLPAHRLDIEITESSLLRNTQLTHDTLSQLHAARGPDLAGRFRHRLFEPELSAQFPTAEGEDRPPRSSKASTPTAR